MISVARARLQKTLLCLVCAAATGCHHTTKIAPPPPLPPPSTVALVPAPESTNAPQMQTVPVTPLPAVPAPVKLKKKKKKIVAAPVVAPVEIASVTPPPAPVNVVGALSAGGVAASEEQQKANESINEVEKRLAGLSVSTQESEKESVTRVKNFVKQANEALRSGDADGALTLATKAKVLLDDLAK